jgi:acyl-phosphate glycerol 3-phosphate acyltransferase
VNPSALSAVAVLASYLIGAIPFGYLVARWVKGIDIRKEGSGNIGATNVGRVLGLRFFCLVFTLDLLKGFLPAWGFPRVVASLTDQPAPGNLAVLAALASILGHNFPVYLGFKGGKGVATSLGAMLALDPVASVAAAAGFVASLMVCRYVSVSSILGGVAFALVHFLSVKSPWSREQWAMSTLTVSLLALLVVRHRKNFSRLQTGTEPKVNLFKTKNDPPKGRIALSWLAALVVAGLVAAGVATFAVRSLRNPTLTIGRYTLRESSRVGTGHQRAERVAFADGGKLLAVTCPRYNRLVLYRVTDADTLEPHRDLELKGKPVAVWPTADRFYVLLRPPGDNRHIEPGWWETFDFHGNSIGNRVRVGYYPDDLALSADGRHAFVVTSGRAEGEPDRPAPALDSYEISEDQGTARPVGRLTFDGKGDDPSRLTLSATGECAVVTLSGSNTVAAVDLFDPAVPVLLGRSPLAKVDHPYASRTKEDWIVMPVASGGESVVVPLAGFGECVAATLPQGSGLEFIQSGRQRSLGRLVLRAGALGVATTRPTGLAFCPDRGLIAVANRSGGVHLVTVRAATESLAARVR